MSKQIVLRSFAELAEHFGVPPVEPDEGSEMIGCAVLTEHGDIPAAAHEIVVAGDGALMHTSVSYAVGEALSPGVSVEPSGTDESGEAGVASHEGAPAGEPTAEAAGGVSEINLAGLLADLERASAALAAAARHDREVRAMALRDLERYDVAVAAQREAELVRDRAHQMRRDAEALLESAYGDEARAEAGRVLALAADVETAAERLAAERRDEAERLVERLDLQKALAERRREEEAEMARAAEAERARRLSAALAEARGALDAGLFEEARALLGPLGKEFPYNADVASLTTIMARLELNVKIDAAEDALWAARRDHRNDPAAAVARLERLDVTGLPEPLARQVFGEWARACHRRCQREGIADTLRYAPRLGCGAVLVRERPDQPYVVLSAIGMDGMCRPGSAATERQVRWARPLAGR